MTLAFSPVLRALALAGLLAILTACGEPATPAQPGATESPTEAAAAVDANVTDGCVDEPHDGTDYFPDKVEFEHASGLAVEYVGSHKVVEVDTQTGGEPLRYVLVQCGTEAPDLAGDLADATVVEVPVQTAITLTTTNLPHFAELDAADAVVGVGTADFVATEEILERIEAGEVDSYAGPDGQTDAEAVIGAQPDLLIMDAFGETIVEEAQRFNDADVPAVLNADFNEQSLLGRAEWLKFTALFLNAEAAANETFAEIQTAYDDVVAAAAEADDQPAVFANTPYEGTWYMPGGNSYFANAVADANGAYVFADDESTGSLELDIETVLDRAGDADVWLQAGSVNGTLRDLRAIDPRFREFKAFRDGQVWAYDKATTAGGGNAVFETAYTRADLFLADLVAILHPDVLPDHELMFFGQVPRGGDQ